ncbi:MAG: response regulator [Firmicutes bacterium]|nr:response regulator [Bacillota bacterium]
MKLMIEKVLLVDDDSSVILALERKLFNSCAAVKAENGAVGLKLLQSKGPFAAIISDYRMPQMDGLQFLEEAANLAPETVRIMLTGYADLDIALQAINRGSIFRFLTKPCSDRDMLKAVDDALQQYRLITAERELIQNTLTGSIRLLTDLFSAVQPDSFARAGNISRLAKRVAERVGIRKTWEIEMAALLSQVGTMTLPAELIERKFCDEGLTEQEDALFKAHSQIGSKFIANIPRLEEIARAVLFQFRGFDGSGPPDEVLQGEKIPLLARVLKVVLDYDYHYALERIAMRSLKRLKESKQLYDPRLLAALEAEILNIENGYQYMVSEVEIPGLESGMVLVDGVYDRNGALLIARGTVITAVLKERLANYNQVGIIENTLKVLVKTSRKFDNDAVADNLLGGSLDYL